ncbi:hypothetical protein KKC83_05475 [Patescibacteria group bacterium]|nr:hypothetical protein [Candidatus Falkowbacteria bacterium]MBU3906496.1 hypothetical protein [Patescibacteria group bacterium]MBU4015609.1 hypothetical protein [Patescibacteria group bacterium]MBU4026965.1 hypothetical protein [Patescibacteria group bacterium]MBU4072656.1 hypothetical protein [Patescibacteria group bacterium]
MFRYKIKHPIDLIRPFILQPLCWKGNNFLTTRSRKKFFLSFGDAITCILKQYKCSPEKDIVLMPNFFCTETLTVISRFLNIVFYKINDDFSIDTKNYFEQIERHKPRVIWNYNFLGIPFTEAERKKIKDLCAEETIIIEDAAHYILHQEEIHAINSHHFYIDSIRKHSSFLGSHLINANFIPQKDMVENWNIYKTKACFYRLTQNFIDFCFYFSNAKLFSILGNNIFLTLNDIIGNYSRPTLGENVSYFGYGLLDLQKIRKHNKNLALIYNHYFQKLKTPLIKTLPNEVIKKSRLTSYYPLFVEKSILRLLEQYLEKNGIFASQLWKIENYYSGLNENLYDSFIVFPLTWLIQEKEIIYSYKKMKEFFQNHKQ